MYSQGVPALGERRYSKLPHYPFVGFLDGAQGAAEEPGLPEFALRAPAPVDRVLSRGEAAPRPYFMASEIVTGYTGAPMQCPSADGSGRKTQAVR